MQHRLNHAQGSAWFVKVAPLSISCSSPILDASIMPVVSRALPYACIDIFA